MFTHTHTHTHTHTLTYTYTHTHTHTYLDDNTLTLLSNLHKLNDFHISFIELHNAQHGIHNLQNI